VKALVSILIPAYNSEGWIGDSLRSALSQTWNPKEIIVVDDGSTDRTLSVAQEFEADGVRVVTQRNQGAAAARNAAFALCSGSYIQWLDADDLLAPDKIALQAEVLESCGSKRTLMASAWGRFLYRYDRAEFTPTPLWCDLSPAEWLTRKMAENLHQQTATWLVTRELTEAAGPWNTKLLGDDDGEYFCRVLLASDLVRFVPDSRVYYRAAGTGSLSYIGSSNAKLEAQWHSMKLHIGYLRSLEDSPEVRSACIRYLQNWLGFFHPERMDLVENAKLLANELGGELVTPRLSWKYHWLEAAFGLRMAKRAQVVLPAARWALMRSWDKALFKIQNRAITGVTRSSAK
jgi:glycosyltransferase involved in cell wall biosynthesis